MLSTRFLGCCVAALCLAVVSATSEKQIKLEDIEKDTLKAAQQAKYENQVQQHQHQQQQPQQQQQQQLQYQQTSYQYTPQVYTQQSLAYQAPTTYSQYLVPQQYVQPTVASGYSPLTSNSLGAGYATPSAHAFQTYLAPQLNTIPSVSSFHAGTQLAAATQTQPVLMTFASPALSAFQQQPYYQSALQYYPASTGQTTQFYYAPQSLDHSSSQLASAFVYPSAQQYFASYQPVSGAKATAAYTQHYVSTAPQTFPTQAYATQQDYSGVYTPHTYSSNSLAYAKTETPTFVTVKAPQHLVASQGQQQQFIQANNPTTLSPVQTKYLNSPQYLAQNYNTIQSSHLYPKGPLSAGVKSTVSPPAKAPAATSYVSNNFGAASAAIHSYHPFRALPAKTF